MKQRRSILVISPIPTHPANAGNRARLYSLLKHIKEAGFKISFFYLDQGHKVQHRAMAEAWDEYHRIFYGKDGLRRMVTKLRMLAGKCRLFEPGAIDAWISRFGSRRYTSLMIDSWYDPTIDKVVRGLIEQNSFDAVLVEYVYLSRVLELFPNDTIKIIDTHDVFSNRHLQFIEKGKSPVFFYTSPEQEAIGLGRSDIILAIQDNDRRYFAGLCERSVITIGHLPRIDVVACAENCEPSLPKVLYVATNTVPNQDGMDFFIRDVWPIINKKCPWVRVDVVGSVCSYLRGRIDEGIELHDMEDDLSVYYKKNYVVVNPVRIGTGLKIKNVEALFSGKPLVTTSVGAQGLEQWGNNAFLLADDAQGFAEAVVKLLTDRTARRELQEGAVAFARRYRNEYEEALQTLVARLS